MNRTESADNAAFLHDPRWNRAVFWFLVLTTVLRLFALSRMELVPDEAYYWEWSRRLDWGYYDQGPMIGYVIRLTTAIFGGHEFGVRFGVLAASLGTLICCATLARRIYSPFAAFLTVVLLGATPLMAVGSLIATYDPLLVFFWAATLVNLHRALFSETIQEQRVGWLMAGITTGWGFLSKHTMLLILPCLLIFLFASPPHRFWLRRPEPYFAFALVLILYSGVFYWNVQHHGWTFGHLLFLTKKTSGTPLRRLGDFVGSQAILLGPVLFLGTLAACRQVLKSLWGLRSPSERQQTFSLPSTTAGEGAASLSPPLFLGEGQGVGAYRLNPKSLLLLCLGLPVLLFFCLLTMKAKVQGNWCPCAWLTLTMLWAGMLSERGKSGGRWASAAFVTSGLLVLLLASPGLRYWLGLRLPPDSDLSNTATGWRETMTQVQRVREEMVQEGKPVFLAANDYQYASEMAFYLPDRPETFDLFLHFRLTMYAAHIERLKTHLGENAVFVNENESEDGYLRQVFERVEWEPPFPITRLPYYSQPIRTVHIARCYHFRRYLGLAWAEGG